MTFVNKLGFIGLFCLSACAAPSFKYGAIVCIKSGFFQNRLAEIRDYSWPHYITWICDNSSCVGRTAYFYETELTTIFHRNDASHCIPTEISK